jgi:GT2 family glycosyltransferase/glycosyltransferase involved in cell wall biosynthesis
MNAMSPIITAAICTFNRHELLREAVEAILKQSLDRHLFRVLIVDNSMDRVRAESFYRAANFDPIVSIAWSDPPGLSRARNRAAAICDTPFIAFLDDDARPDPGWLAGLITGFCYSSKVAAVGGPILPIWRQGRPHWLPQKHLSMLTIHDALDCDQDLPKHQHLYGANMAFAVERLAATGGFPEQIGRNGTSSLLSCEELQVQDALREAGHVVRFVKSASVRHIVHEDRLRRDWMRSRMIWQSASEQMQDPPRFSKNWALAELKRLAERDPDVRAAARLFFKEAGGEALDIQLDAIRCFSALVMGAHRGSGPILEAELPFPIMPTDVQAEGYAVGVDGYAPSAAGTSNARFVFVEGPPAHQYLYDLFGELPDAQLLTPYMNDQAWSSDLASKSYVKDSLKYIYRSLSRRTKAVFFLTFDSLVYGENAVEFFHFLRACQVPVFGILHRLPDSPSRVTNVQHLDSLVAGICLFSEKMVEHARSILALRNVHYLPHHPTTFAFPNAVCRREKIRAKIGVRPDQVVFGVIGEARRGKGINLLLSAFEHIPPRERERMFFVFAGKARDHSNDEIRHALINARIMGLADLRGRLEDANYRVLSDRRYAEYIAAVDIGLLLYQDDQRNCMSGVLGDFVWSNCKVVATGDSYTGAEVRKHNLGLTLNEESVSSMAAALVEALKLPSISPSPSAREYRERISPEMVLEKLRQLIDGDGAGGKQHDSSGQTLSDRGQEVDDYAA